MQTSGLWGLSADRKELSTGKGLGLVINQINGNGDLIIDKKNSQY